MEMPYHPPTQKLVSKSHFLTNLPPIPNQPPILFLLFSYLLPPPSWLRRTTRRLLSEPLSKRPHTPLEVILGLLERDVDLLPAVKAAQEIVGRASGLMSGEAAIEPICGLNERHSDACFVGSGTGVAAGFSFQAVFSIFNLASLKGERNFSVNKFEKDNIHTSFSFSTISVNTYNMRIHAFGLDNEFFGGCFMA